MANLVNSLGVIKREGLTMAEAKKLAKTTGFKVVSAKKTAKKKTSK